MNTITTNGNSPLFVFRNRFIFLGFLLIFSVPIASFAKESPVLTLRSLGGGGEEPGGLAPNYLFEIYENGFVRYTGERDVKIKGQRTAKITPKQVQQLIATYKAIDDLFKHFKATGRENELYVRHPPYYSFKLRYQGEISEIVPSGWADYMFTNLNKMIPVKDWVCLSKDQDPYQLCPLTPLHPSIYPID